MAGHEACETQYRGTVVDAQEIRGTLYYFYVRLSTSPLGTWLNGVKNSLREGKVLEQRK